MNEAAAPAAPAAPAATPAADAGGDADAPRKIRRGDRQTRFLAQSVILEEAGSSGLIRVAMITISLVICAFLGWSAVTNVDEVAVTSGEVVPAGQVQAIQHLEGGIVRDILIQEGELVEKGKVLMRLDPTSSLAELDQMQARRIGLTLQAERLRALGTGREPVFNLEDERYENMMDDQQTIYESQMDAAENRRETTLKQIDQKRSELEVFGEQEETLARNADILEEELLLRESLFQQGLTSKVVYLDIKREVNKARGDLAKLVTDRQRAAEALAEVRSRLAELETDAREQALAQLGEVTGELAQVNESLDNLRDRVRRLDIVAPVRGIVKGQQVYTVGGVLPAGGVVLEIVPLDKELIVETRITTRDVGHVRIGQPVTIKVTTYDFARFGGITGELRDVSASTFLDENGEPYYKGTVSLDRGYVGFDPEQNRVMPGMTVQADIKTGQKTLLAYLLKPVYSSVSTSFRER